MLICEMAAYYRSIGSSLKQRMEEIYSEYGRYLNKIDSFEFPGLSGMDRMSEIMQGLRDKPLEEIAGYKVVKVTDYKKPEETGLRLQMYLFISWRTTRQLSFVLPERSRRLRFITQRLVRILRRRRLKKINYLRR